MLCVKTSLFRRLIAPKESIFITRVRLVLMEQIKILIADNDSEFSIKAANSMRKYGFECRKVKTFTELEKTLTHWLPHFIIADMDFSELGILDVVSFLREKLSQTEAHLPRVIATSIHSNEDNVQKAFKSGAVDYLVKPFDAKLLLSRLIFQLRRTPVKLSSSTLEISPSTTPPSLGGPKSQPQENQEPLFLEFIESLTKSTGTETNTKKALFQLTKMVSEKMNGVRCNIIQYLSQSEGRVLASSDDEKLRPFKIDLQKYPEVISVVNTGEPLILEDLSRNEDMKSIVELFKDINFNSMVVCPIEFQGRIFGVLALRRPHDHSHFGSEEVLSVQIASHVVGLTLSKLALQSQLKQTA